MSEMMTEQADMKKFRDTFGANIQHVRTKKNMSQELLARRAGITPKYVKQLENGEKNASLDVIVSIANAFGITANELLDGLYPASEMSLLTHPTAAKLTELSVDRQRRAEVHLDLYLGHNHHSGRSGSKSKGE